ncbi:MULTISPECIES: metal ABC transporter solute-binding protein, Zn/Mn family [Methanosarcina]|jgi:zinc transport system substrate-binding protein|uniref:Zinc ABC transporter substrate-binding protein n=6 Tax=Methanosarcina mazei TaxID=2209 RepID=A0A0F8BS66_METMZ|nr:MULTISPECIES: zinc ABC transporter substrate-binding protein [Methanosarcina]AAM31029.1 Zinc ABC transporter, zinc-binding protein [Methanosarcina mazei Go1]AGF96759.1 Zinc ABC transporter, periplasmic-binding protein ZnuA [Methanosarcina mazei Tuc01]AKB42250.1 Zinc ABC transporter, periplasmic-binding protein ZnuA [Methanosarcina mazei WWM610]AKB66525.1 Zinc ABC transporter, periplasmic-binding protein ZnuA [Methanosarcina mazei S-6]AKB73242.1 Zinc ABC transporter, periplasmic-binding prot
MKLKIIPLLVILIVGLSIFVSGCTDAGDSGNNRSTGQGAEISGNEEPIIVAVSVVPQAEFVEKVGGDRVKTVVIVPSGADPHTYEPSPKEVKEISKASMLLTVGVGMPFEEVWIDRFESMNSDTLIINCSEGIELKKLEGYHHHEGEEGHDEELETGHENKSEGNHEELDPHIWTSPSNAKIMVEEIYEGLVELDPENEAYYAQNRDAYLEELDALDTRIREKLEGKEEKNFMVYHPSWGYFAADYGLNMISVEIEGKEPSAQDLTELVDLAKEKDVKVIFVQAQFSTRSAEVLAQEIGGEVVAVDPLAKNYIENMDSVSDIFARNLV